jgi:hypothetical protein
VADEKRTQGGLSVKTLLIAGAASAVAAIVIPLIWRPGTVFAAAMTPIVVALVSELLRRPVETVSAVRERRPARGAEVLDAPFDEPFDPLAPPSAEELEELPRTRAAPRAVHRRPLTARQWKLALATGFVAFAIVAALFTASELLAGDAVSGGGARTTFFGGGGGGGGDGSGGDGAERDEPAQQREREQRRSEEASPTATPEATPTPEAAPTPEATPTPTPTPAETPVPAVPTPAP